MKSSADVSKTRIFNDYNPFFLGRKNNLTVRIYKWILLSLLVVGLLMVLMFIQETFFARKMFSDWTVLDFLRFDSAENKQRNVLILLRFGILTFVFIYAIWRNYVNIYFQKEAIKKYWPWFTSYLVMSITAFILLFTFYSSEPSRIAYLFFILIPLFVLNLAYSIFNYKLKKKTDPNSHNNKISLIVGLVSQFLLIAVVIIGILMWVWSANSKTATNEMLFVNNAFYNFIRQLVNGEQSGSMFIIFAFVLFVLSIVIGSNSNTISFLAFKQNKQEYFKSSILFTITIFVAIIAWTIRILTIKIDNTSVLGKSLNNYYYLFEILFATIIVTLYMLFQFLNRLKSNSHIINTVNLTFAQAILWGSLLLVTTMSKNNDFVNLINLFFVSVSSFVIIASYFFKTLNYNLVLSSFLKFGIIVIVLAIVVFNINHIMLANNNKTFQIINSSLEFTQFFTLIASVVWILFLLGSTIWLLLVANKITFFKNKVKKNMRFSEIEEGVIIDEKE
ncbi:MSC_0624 family F1-like ATPase-associated membrane protein [Mycoplasma enhydrae]|uniref:MSC_0624 family F1-like ATPase-associated membrane protein n=1 Tax=Mycoplasma enhydrae TaxID=2499220 RepID=UPI00197C55A6|nr:hypothetical protein [Mycoplasma enhydrae]MBN4089648.1 hypothetical protein [Mycoplasma enhydrae]